MIKSVKASIDQQIPAIDSIYLPISIHNHVQNAQSELNTVIDILTKYIK